MRQQEKTKKTLPRSSRSLEAPRRHHRPQVRYCYHFLITSSVSLDVLRTFLGTSHAESQVLRRFLTRGRGGWGGSFHGREPAELRPGGGRSMSYLRFRTIPVAISDHGVTFGFVAWPRAFLQSRRFVYTGSDFWS